MKQINPIDRHVGARARMRRLMLKMSLTELGDALGLTGAQVHKYEMGVVRIGASRLQNLCTILNVPVSFFFDGAPPALGLPDAPETETDGEVAALNGVLATSDGVALVKGFTRLRDPKVRRAIVALIEQITAESDSTLH